MPGSGPARRHRRARRPAVVVLLLVTALFAGAGVAWAGWVMTGAGSGRPTAASGRAPTTTTVPGSAVTSGLLSPRSTGTVVVLVNNPNPYAVRVTRLNSRGAATGSGGIGTCGTTGVTFVNQTPGTTVAAASSATLVLPGAAAMSNASESGCQRATFTIPVTVTIDQIP